MNLIRTKLLTTVQYSNSLRRLEFLRKITCSRCLLAEQNVHWKPSFSFETTEKDTRHKQRNVDLSSGETSDQFDLDAFLRERESRTISKGQTSRLDGLFQLPKNSVHQQNNNESSVQPDIRRNLYEPTESTLNRPQESIDEFRRTHNIKTSSDAPAPIFTLDELQSLPRRLIDEFHRNNIRRCTPIQAQGIPIALSGNNLIGMAQTG